MQNYPFGNVQFIHGPEKRHLRHENLYHLLVKTTYELYDSLVYMKDLYSGCHDVDPKLLQMEVADRSHRSVDLWGSPTVKLVGGMLAEKENTPMCNLVIPSVCQGLL